MTGPAAQAVSATQTVHGALTLKINSSYAKGSLQQTADATRTPAAGKAQARDAAQAGAGTAVELSSTARHLALLAGADNDINTVRIDEIRNALKEGTLKINPERIADGLIASAQELVSKK